MPMLDFFNKIIEYFEKNHIPYMLSGSIAMGLFIIPRATKDIDFVVRLQAEDVNGFVNHFDGAYHCSKDAVNRQSLFNVIDHRSGFKADFVVLKNSEYRLTEFERKQKMNFFGVGVYVVSPKDLLISKLIWIQDWQAAVQMEDIKNLVSLPNLQREYIDYNADNLISRIRLFINNKWLNIQLLCKLNYSAIRFVVQRPLVWPDFELIKELPLFLFVNCYAYDRSIFTPIICNFNINRHI